MHSIELLLSPADDAAVRDTWQRLSEAGLPSPARHTGPTNAPHVTLLAAPRLDGAVDEPVRRSVPELPRPARLGGLVVFDSGRSFVVARLVVVDAALLDLHAAVHDAVRAASPTVDVVPNTAPRSWTPHVTLASRLDATGVASALDVLRDAPALDTVTLDGLRRWDSDAVTVTRLAGRN